jgi:hypothetical protein
LIIISYCVYHEIQAKINRNGNVQAQPIAMAPVQAQPIAMAPVQAQPIAMAPVQAQPIAMAPVQAQPIAMGLLIQANIVAAAAVHFPLTVAELDRVFPRRPYSQGIDFRAIENCDFCNDE